MKVQNKPDYLIFASDAPTGELEAFPNIARGWGITIEQTESKPPMEWMNDAFNRIDKNTLYLLQQGIPEWDSVVIYPIDSVIKYQSELYIALTENDNAIPSNHLEKWKKVIPDIKEASTTQQGIVQLSSVVDSDSEQTAATSKAVKTVNDKVSPISDHITINDGNISTDVYAPKKRFIFQVKDNGDSGVWDVQLSKWAYSFNIDGYLNDGAAGIGVNQSWVDVTSDRALNAIYTNTSNKPIFVSIETVASGQLVNVYVNGVIANGSQCGTNAFKYRTTLSVIVPPFTTYCCSCNGNVVLTGWRELK